MTRFLLILVYALTIFSESGCRPDASGLELDGRQRLDGIPSGSALLVQGDSAWVVSDDAPVIFRLHLGTLAVARYPFGNGDSSRLSKEVKYDLEAAVRATWAGRPHLLAFGSGTLSPQRDSLLLFPLQAGAKPHMLEVAPLYRHLQQAAGILPADWNLEGATLSGDTLYLFNRGSNAVLRCSLTEVLGFVADTLAPRPRVSVQQVQLPAINGLEARFSGASPAGSGRIVFCASVEDTGAWTQDGEVLGSFIGIYDTHAGRVEHTWLLTGKNGKALKEKLESVDLLRQERDGRLALLAIADNDNGSSNLLRLSLRF